MSASSSSRIRRWSRRARPTWCARWSATKCRSPGAAAIRMAGSAPASRRSWRRSTSAWSEAGVAILVDLGGAETNSEMAVEMLPEERAGRVVVCNAPIVEGAVIAATEASGGASLGCGEAHGRRAVAGVSGRTVMATKQAKAPVLMTHAVGLHARPSVKLTKLAKTLRQPHRAGAGDGRAVDRRQEHRQGDGDQGAEGHGAPFARRGRGCRAAVEALVGLVERDFDEAPAGGAGRRRACRSRLS